MSNTKIDIVKFDGDGDFSMWKRRMFAYLSVSGLKDVLIPKPPRTEEEEDEKDLEVLKKRSADDEARLERCDRAKNMIFLSVGDHVLRKIEECEAAAETWSMLEELYMPKTLLNRVHAQLQLYGFKMQDHRSINENIDDFLKIVRELRHLNIDVPEEVQAVLVLNALPQRFDNLKETLKYSRNVLKLEEVASAARSKEKESRNGSSTRSSSEGYFARGRSETRSSTSKNRHNSRSRSKSIDRKKTCWICGKEGHFKKQCFKWLDKNKAKTHGYDKGEAAVARDDAQDLAGLLAYEANLTQGNADYDEWILDSGCSFHMTHRKDVFLELKEVNQDG